MNHIEVEATGEVERYLLGELNEAEQLGFEQHYFECGECAEHVRLSTIFETNLQAVLREPFPLPRESGSEHSTAPARRQWPTLAAMAAAVVMAAGLGYQNLVQLPQLRQALALADAEDSPATYYLAETRSEGDTLVVPNGARHVSLLFNQTPGRTFPFYDCTLQDESGATVRQFRVPVRPNLEEWQLRLSTRGLSARSYILKVRGAAAESGLAVEQIAEYHFRLEFR